MSGEWHDPLVTLPEMIPLGVGERAHTEAGAELLIEPLRAFLERELPPSESLVGVPRDGTNLLPRYGWVLAWGREGSAKTSILVDLLFHACAGVDWLGWPVGRPLRIVVIVNEGIPGGLQDKLRQKLERWEGDRDAVLDNLAVYASPWGEFTFADQRMAEHARDYALAFGTDYVAFDPLHTIGPLGSGTPQETETFKHVLRRFGLWQDLGVITAHHSNKAGMVSGDWARHADTVLHLEKDGKNAATKLTLQKARPAAPSELGVPSILEWLVDDLSYRRRELELREPVAEPEVLRRILEALAETSPLNMGQVQKALVGVDTHRTKEVVLASLASGALRNVSTAKVRTDGKPSEYKLVSGAVAAPDATEPPPADVQTRMNTEPTSGGSAPPDVTGNGRPPSAEGSGGWTLGPWKGPPTPDTERPPDNLEDLF